jgi:uncharacterized protein with HEPN domain
MPDDAATILDIVLACQRVARFIAVADQKSFLEDDEKHWAVVSQLMLIGEAVRRLPPNFCDQHQSIPWPQIAAMRNRLIHHYDKIDWPLVWVTASRDVPALLKELESQVPEDGDKTDE